MSETPEFIEQSPNLTEIYTDGICQAHCINDAIKLDLVTINPSSGGKSSPIVTKRIVMTLPQFINSVNVINQMIDNLVAAKRINKE